MSKKLAKSIEHLQHGLALHQAGELAKALRQYEQAAALNPQHGQIQEARGVALAQLQRNADALKCLNRAANLSANSPSVFINRGNILNELGRSDEALIDFDRAVALGAPDAPLAYSRGNALAKLGRHAEALNSFDRALALQPDMAAIYNSKGSALFALERLTEALDCFAIGLRLNPELAEAYYNRGRVWQKLRRMEEALLDYERAAALKPDDHLIAMERQCLLGACAHWAELPEARRRFEAAIRQGAAVLSPFALLALFDDPGLHRIAAAANFPKPANDRPALPAGPYPGHERIRLGYFSADFHNHATMHLLAEVLEQHDRAAFEVVGFSFGQDASDDPWRLRAISACDRFEDVRDRTPDEIAARARELEVDIAIDLKGFTEDCRSEIFVKRAAPVQVSYLGYPGTMSHPSFDYIIADRMVIPAGTEPNYSEKVVYLPGSYQSNCRVRTITKNPMTRAEAGLPAAAFVYACFNQTYKITPEQFGLWMRILGQADESVLWLLADNAAAMANLHREAAMAGIDPERLVFARKLPVEEHLGRIGLADLFIDTFPINAHTTASDALRMNLPVVTFAGRSFASRVGASLLSAVGLPELITETPDDFLALAVALAADRDRLARIRRHLAETATSSPLFDSERFTRHLEAAYRAMQARSLQGLAPDHIVA